MDYRPAWGAVTRGQVPSPCSRFTPCSLGEDAMRVSIMGLGYVGAVSAGCLAKEGHEVIGVDPQQAKVDLINAGKTPIIEKDIGEIIREQVDAGRLVATTDV